MPFQKLKSLQFSGNLFLQKAFKSRDKIAEIGAPFIRDNTVKTPLTTQPLVFFVDNPSSFSVSRCSQIITRSRE